MAVLKFPVTFVPSVAGKISKIWRNAGASYSHIKTSDSIIFKSGKPNCLISKSVGICIQCALTYGGISRSTDVGPKR